MGCAPSGSAHGRSGIASNYQVLTEWLRSLLADRDPQTLLSAYVDLERSIINEENQSPASVMNVCMSRQQQIKGLLLSADERINQGGELLPQENSMDELFADLGLRGNSAVAAEHEEFIANVNRRSLHQNLLRILKRRLAATEETMRRASINVGKLHSLYEKQDMLLGHIYGESYANEKERLLEEEIDTMKNYRDAFSSGVIQWQDSENNVREAADLLSQGVGSWRSIEARTSMLDKISKTTEARDKIQEAVVLVELSQNSMPGVQFPYCTKRELTSISQAIEYVFTDILIEDRYRHAHQVYKNFQERASALRSWINQVLNTTLRKDLTDIDANILTASKKLKMERIAAICEKLGIENKFSPFGLNPAVNRIHPIVSEKAGKSDLDVKRKGIGGPLGFHAIGSMFEDPREFERNLAARRDTLWPSRRIEELMNLNNAQAL